MAQQLPRRERQVIPTAQDRLAAKLIVQDHETIKDALIQAGFSPHRANRGQAGLSRGIRTAMIEIQGASHQALGRELLTNPVQIEEHVTGWLYSSMMDRNSKGVAAAKLLGQHRRVDMFAADNQQNVLVIQAPADWHPEASKDRSKDEPKQLPPSEAEFPDYE